MRIIYTRHAKERMSPAERSVSEEEVSAVLETPDVKRPGKDGALIADKTIGGRRISVVYRQDKGDIIVITVVVL